MGEFNPEDWLQLDIDKVTSLEDIKLILSCLGFTVHRGNPAVMKLFHLIADDEKHKIINNIN